MTLPPSKGGKLCYVIEHNVTLVKLVVLHIAGCAHTKCLTEHTVLYLAEHQTSFQVFCQYIYLNESLCGLKI